MAIQKLQGKTKDGIQAYRIFVSYKDRSGNYKKATKTVYGSASAKAAEAALKKQLSDAPPESRMTVADLFDEYCKSVQPEMRRSTYEKTYRNWQLHILPYLSDVTLPELTPAVLREWKNQINALELKIQTKQNIYKELRKVLNFAVRQEMMLRNPLMSVGQFKSSEFVMPEEAVRYYTADQFKQFITAAESHTKTLTDHYATVFFYIAFYTGMRKGEINALRWSDLQGDILHVRRSVAQKVKGEAFVETPPKNKSSYRSLQIPAKLTEILEQQRIRQMQIRGFSQEFRIVGGNTVLSDSTIENRNRQYAQEADLPHIRIHDFRHSHASLLCNARINIQEVARRLGHADVSMTWNTYSHMYPKEEERAVSVLNELKI